MNNKQKDNGWILCSSKSFPGKYYYFNVLNGETAWTLTETQVEKTKKLVHSNYPEPSTKPPENSSSHLSTPSQLRTPVTTLGSKEPSFGEICFPLFVPTKDLPKYVWAPVPIMYINERSTPSFQVLQSNTSLIELNNDKNQSIKDNNGITVKVHTCDDQYVSKRFITYNNIVNTQENNQTDVKNTNENPFRTSTSSTTKYIKNPNFIFHSINNNSEHKEVTFNFPTNNINTFRDVINNSFATNKTTFGHGFDTPDQPTPVFGAPGFEFNAPNETYESNTPKEAMLCTCDTPKKTPDGFDVSKKAIRGLNKNMKIAFGIDSPNKRICWFDTPNKANIQETQAKIPDRLNNLAEDDLRKILLQRKRKIENTRNSDENSKKMTASCSERQSSSKKRVTFKLDSLEDLSYMDEQVLETPPSPAVESITSLRRLGATDGTWFIAIDLDVLLEHFDYIDAFVITDPLCCLIVPYSVYKELTTTSTACESSAPRARLNAARNVLRRLGCRYARHRVQNEVNESEKFKSQKDQIQCCCLELIRNNIHVVLITNNNILYKEAKEKRIHVFKMAQIENGETKTADVTIDFQKIKLNNPNDNSVQNSLENNFVNIENQSGIHQNVANERYDQRTDAKLKNCVENFWFSENSDSCDLNTVSQEIKNLNVIEKPSQLTSKEQIQNDGNVTSSFFSKKTLKFFNKTENNGNDNQSSIFATDSNFMPLTTKTMESYLKKFNFKNKMVEDSLKNNGDERMCCFRQIMENLADILQEPSSKVENSRACVLYNILQRIRKSYGKHELIRGVIVKLQMLLYRSEFIDKIRSDLLPIEIMQTIGCGLLLVQLLQELIPSSDHLTDIEKGLNDLIESIENPSNMDVLWSEINIAPSKEYRDSDKEIEIEFESIEQYCEHSNFIKEESGIIKYLKKHYPAWSHFDETTTSLNQKPKIKIFRTFGRDLHQFKLNSKSRIIRKEANKNGESNSEQNSIQFKEYDRMKTGKKERDYHTVFQNKENDENPKTMASNTFLKIIDSEKELKGFKNTENTGPKEIKLWSNNKFELKKTDLDLQNEVNGLKNTDKTEPNVIRLFTNDKTNIDFKKADINSNNCDFNLNQNKHGNTSRATETGPKVLRNILPTPKNEDLFNNTVHNGIEDYENSKNDSKFDVDNDNNSKISKITTKNTENNDNLSSVCDNLDLVESSIRTVSNRTVCDTEIGYKTLLKRFFEELRSCFREFIKFFSKKMKKPENKVEIKSTKKTAKQLHVHMVRIIGSLSELFTKYEENNSNNIFITKTREVISVLLAQAKNIDQLLIKFFNLND